MLHQTTITLNVVCTDRLQTSRLNWLIQDRTCDEDWPVTTGQITLTTCAQSKKRSDDTHKVTERYQTFKAKHNPEKQATQNIAKQTTLVQSPFTTLGQETRWAYSTMLLSPHGAWKTGKITLITGSYGK